MRSLKWMESCIRLEFDETATSTPSPIAPPPPPPPPTSPITKTLALNFRYTVFSTRNVWNEYVSLQPKSFKCLTQSWAKTRAAKKKQIVDECRYNYSILSQLNQNIYMTNMCFPMQKAMFTQSRLTSKRVWLLFLYSNHVHCVYDEDGDSENKKRWNAFLDEKVYVYVTKTR